MILELIKHDYAALWLKLVVVSGAWGCVLLAILIDLYFGVKKSKALGEHTSSEGYRRSIQKFNYYYALLVFALIFDALLPISYYMPFPLSTLPIITLLGAVALIFTEAKSVREKGDAKLRRKTDASFRQIIDVLKKEDILNKLIKAQSDEKESADNSI
ncbi:phage holin family protein [Chryseobacterium sp. PTM-20240506]|uniref:phage holin family protein n=1 Tax=Chryseobacterium sp. PTM-20240506 TaxID=3400631 RepID=UPI003AAE7FE3